MAHQDHVAAFIDTLAGYDGVAPFSDAKLPIDPESSRVVIVAENDEVVAVGAVAAHVQSNGTVHGELETAVRPVMRFPAFEGAVLDATLPLIAGADTFSVWSRRSSLDAALEDRGFALNRILDFLVVDLPLSGDTAPPTDRRIRTFVPSDIEGLTQVNRSAFNGHREAAALDVAEMRRYRSESWFDDQGIFIAERGGVAGFCWTRVHPDGDGEIFRIAVDPAHQGSGIGLALLRAGFRYLAALSGVHRGVLWVDRSNTAATALYRSLGMERERSNREFALETLSERLTT